MNHNAYNAGYNSVIKTAGLSDMFSGGEKKPSMTDNATGLLGGAFIGSTVAQLVAAPGVLSQFRTELSAPETALNAQITKQYPVQADGFAQKALDTLNGTSDTQRSWELKLRDLLGHDRVALQPGEGYSHIRMPATGGNLPEGAPDVLVDFISYPKGSKLSPESLLHEAGHATNLGRKPVRLLRGLHTASIPLAILGGLAGSGMALSGDEDLEKWAPAVAGVAALGSVPEEIRAIRHGDRYLKKLAPLSGNPKQLMRGSRGRAALGLLSYLGLPLGLASGVGAMTYLRDRSANQE